MEHNPYLQREIDAKEERMVAAIERVEADLLNDVGTFAEWLINSLPNCHEEVCAMSYRRWSELLDDPMSASIPEAIRMTAPDCSSTTRQNGLIRLWDLFLTDHRGWIQQEAEKSL